MAPRCLSVLVALLLPPLAGCSAPTLSDLDADQGPEHTLVEVSGSNLFAARIVWDAGTPAEREIPGGFLGPYMFSVPPGAAPGVHPVALRNANGTSATLDFTVTPPQPFGPPRVDRVTVVAASFSGNQVDVALFVQGANIDVGAVVVVDGVDVATIAHKGLKHDLLGTDPVVLGYPIYHYLGLFALPDPMNAGASIDVQVRNLDGVTSAAFDTTLPTDADSLDSDGDALLDVWERDGYDADGDGSVDVDLPALGADPDRPDIFVEIDVMQGLGNPPIQAAGGNPGVFELATSMFADAPVLNPWHPSGINLVIDATGTLANSPVLHFGTIVPGNATTTDFVDLRDANFTAARDDVYHYGIWGDMMVGGFSGISDVDFGGSGVGDDFLVSFDDFGNAFQTLRSQVETLVHELGHGLGQRHGGLTHRRFNPQYWSAMSYTWQLRSGRTDANRVSRVTCAPIYWSDAAALEPNGAPPAAPNAVTDYSHGMGPTLVENDGSLQEPTGVCGPAVDWNDDGDNTDTDVSTDANDEGGDGETLVDVSNWRELRFDGPASDGSL